VELLGLDDRVTIRGATERQLSYPFDAPPDGDPAVSGVDFGIEEPVGGDEEPALREVASLGLVLEVERRLEHGEDAAAQLILRLEDVASQDHHPSLVSLGMSEEVLEGNGSPGLIPELLGDGGSASREAKSGR
jgi:hypothetical protein